MKYLYVTAVAVMLLSACNDDTKPPLKAGWLRIEWPSLNATHVAPIVMDDGTKCVVAGGNTGVAISCDWGKKK
jgi:hypothetical protein